MQGSRLLETVTSWRENWDSEQVNTCVTMLGASLSDYAVAEKKGLRSSVRTAEQKVKGLQERFGVKVYGAVVEGAHAEVQNILAEFKPQIDALELKIQNNKNQMAAIDKEVADA